MNVLYIFLLNIIIPKRLKFGQDISKIEFHGNKVTKYFKDIDKFNKTLEFNNKISNNHFPKIYDFNKNELRIDFEDCGELLSLYNLPSNWEKQFDEIRYVFNQIGFYILDLRFLPFTPFVINNICVKNDKIYIVDHTMWYSRPEKYINMKINLLKFQIKLYLFLKKCLPILFFVHILLEIIRILFIELIEIIIFRDITIFYELRLKS